MSALVCPIDLAQTASAAPAPEATPRVLLVAYQCGPGMGSVSQIGWEWYARLAARGPVTLVTHVRNRDALQAAGAPLPGTRIVWIDTEWFAGPLYRAASRVFPRSQHATFLVSSIDWFVFDRAVLRAMRARSGEHDLVHRVTPVTPWAPTRLGALGLPLVLGPLNGGLDGAPGFGRIAGADGQWLRHLRPALRLLDAVTGSTRRAARILVATRATLRSVPRGARHKTHSMLENGVDTSRFAPTPWPAAPSPSVPLRVAFVGRLVPVKAVDLLIDALARVRARRDVRLEIVGDGPMLCALREQAARLGLGDAVRFHGARDAGGVAATLRDCHLLCLPSVRESGGAVLLEAMACARPVVALAFGGPGEVVDDGVGAALQAGSPQELTQRLAETLEDAFDHPERWRARAETALERARAQFDWKAKVDSALDLYARVLLEASDAGTLSQGTSR